MFSNWSTIALHNNPSTGPSDSTLKPSAAFSGTLVFPRYTNTPSESKPPTFTVPASANAKSFYSYFQRIRKASDITREHLDVLGVEVEYDVPAEDILPEASKTTKPLKKDGTEEEGGWFPDDEDAMFKERKRELLIKNQDAYDSLARINKTIKLGHMYRFFQNVELVSTYYVVETSDTTYPAEAADPSVIPSTTVMSVGVAAGEGACKRKADEETQGGVEKKGRPEILVPPDKDAEEIKDVEEEKKERFAMPEKFREEMVKNFVEPLCWAYGVRVYPSRLPPKLSLQSSRFVIHLTNYVYLTPSLPAEARAGLVEGPVLGLQVRHEHSFRPSPPPSTPAELHSIAPKKKKRRPSAGAGCGSLEKKVLETADKMEVDSREELILEEEDTHEGDVQDVVGVIREVACAVSLAQDRRKGPKWGADAKEGKVERKVRFRAVGKSDQYFDDIYIITSLHHHISISNIRISQPYLRFLENGKLPDPNHEFIKQGGWDKIKIRKSKYWSLLIPEERVDAARAVAGVLKWLARNEVKR
ncbi:hypothetical protein RUND412_002480 [Rhizina undulata]